MSDESKLSSVASTTYREQAIWFLNAFWDKHGAQAEKIWGYVLTMQEIDTVKKEAGNALDELQAHVFLEKFNETLTVKALRDSLRATGAIGANLKLIALIHILIAKYKVDWHVLVNTPQGDPVAIARAQKMLQEVSVALQECERRTAEARRQEAPFKAAQEEVDAALAEVKAQEDARNRKIEDLKAKSNSGGAVQANKAKNELAQTLAEDPLPLRKAKITLEAALKKAEKARAPFEAATKQAEAARAIASQAAKEAERTQRAAEEALEEARRKVAEAEAYLEEAKARLPKGQIWWFDRELNEKKKYMPKARGGIDKK